MVSDDNAVSKDEQASHSLGARSQHFGEDLYFLLMSSPHRAKLLALGKKYNLTRADIRAYVMWYADQLMRENNLEIHYAELGDTDLQENHRNQICTHNQP